MKYEIELPKILYLTLEISKFAKKEVYYNTNDLIRLAHELKPELVRTRKDKKDYKFLEDTSYGGLRGNFSTVLTLRGYIKINNRYTTYYGIGKTDRLFNAFKNGEIILVPDKNTVYTNNKELLKLLEKEAKNYKLRETQAHLKNYLKKHPDFPLKRDKINFSKLGVLKSSNNQYFLRILFNTFITENIVEFSMLNYLKGTKIKQFNMHPLFVIPSYDDPWEEFYTIDAQELLTRTPLFIYYDKQQKQFYDEEKYIYKHYNLQEGLLVLSKEDGNINERLNYNWQNIKKKLVTKTEIKDKIIKQDEFSVFLENFLKWQKEFTIYDKEVVNEIVSSSGGPDVILQYSGGTTQKLELEHNWNNYILHKHYKNKAWQNTWLYAEEEWDFKKIKKVFTPYLKENIDCIPKVFLCTNKNTKEKEAYEVDWNELKYTKLKISD